MGNICCCCLKRSQTPYDPFIYDQEYEEYYDPNPLDPRVINTYNPPTVIQLDHTNYRDSINNNPNSSVINVNEFYSNSRQPAPQQQKTYHSPSSTSIIEPTPNTDNNRNTSFIQSPTLQQHHQQQDTRYMTSSFNDLHKGYQDQNTNQQPQQQTFVNNNQQQQQQHDDQSYKPFQEESDEDSDLYEKDEHIHQQQPQQHHQQQPQQQNIQPTDQFYSHYTNFTESHYDINPPTNDLGITDSIMDSIVLGVNNNNNNINKFNNFSNNNNQPQQQQQQTTTTTTSSPSNSNINNSANNSNVFNSPNSSINSSNIENSSIYYDAVEGSTFSQQQ